MRPSDSGARRARLFGIADDLGLALAAMGTHPWANYLDQHIIDTEHYQRLEQDLRWVAQRNNTWSLHVHVGVHGPDRAVAVSDRMRELLPPLLALSANSPFLDHRDTGLHSVRTEIFTRTFPRCGVHEPFGDWRTYADFVQLLQETDSIVEATQLWWSVRPHHAFGTVEVRICDAQTRGDESLNLAALIAACVAQAAIDLDEGRSPSSGGGWAALVRPARDRGEPLASDPLWNGRRDDRLPRAAGRTRRGQVLEDLVEWTEPARQTLGVDVELPERNGAQRAYAQLRRGRADRGDLPPLGRGDPQDLRTGGSSQWQMRNSSQEETERRARRPSGQGPSEEELRAQLEEEIRKVRVEDVVLQSVVSILNLSARRIAKDDERDLEQAKVGIDAARALVDLVNPEAQPQLRQAISELQVLYAKHAGEESAPEQGSSRAAEGRFGAVDARRRPDG